MKRIGDWLQVLGINTMDEHLSYVTLRGARKRDHPQSFSYHEPWWRRIMNAQYLAPPLRRPFQGEQINRILVIEPTTAWMYQGNEAKLRQIGDSFFRFLMALEAAQIEYDPVRVRLPGSERLSPPIGQSSLRIASGPMTGWCFRRTPRT
jgi:hypothetical protein